MVRILEALRHAPMRFNQICDRTGLARRFVGNYLKELKVRGIVAHDPKNKRYGLSANGLKVSFEVTNAQFLTLHPSLSFTLSLGIEGPPVEGITIGPMEVDYAYSTSLSCDGPIRHLIEIFRKRSEYAPGLFLTQLLQLAYERGLADKKAWEGGKLPRFSARKWRAIFKTLCPRGHELVWLERIDLRNLLRVLTHPRGWEAASGLTVRVGAHVRPSQALRVDRRTSTLEV